mmetsp:Transcript_23352/g.39309  ORF Transcript_23352/g.39309 Transcript_23352/m.39309 type:complete len:355 (-) Transcript_23352:171-1235(-)
MTPDDTKNLGACNINDEDANRTIKVAVTKVKVEDSHGDCKKPPALWDGGSMPKSFVSPSTARRSGLLDQVTKKERKRAQADGSSSVKTVGELMLKPQVPGSDAETQIETRAAMTLSMELLLGQDAPEKSGGITSFCNHKTHCAKLPKKSGRTISQNTMRLDQWTSESSVDASEFVDLADNKLPAPTELRKKNPGKTIRQVTELLDKTPPADDWDIDKGKKHINKVSNEKHSDVTKPTTKPSSKLTPAKIELKEGCEECIVNDPEHRRPEADMERETRAGQETHLPFLPPSAQLHPPQPSSEENPDTNTVVAQIFLLEQGRITPNPEKVAAPQQAPKPTLGLQLPSLRLTGSRTP